MHENSAGLVAVVAVLCGMSCNAIHLPPEINNNLTSQELLLDDEPFLRPVDDNTMRLYQVLRLVDGPVMGLPNPHPRASAVRGVMLLCFIVLLMLAVIPHVSTMTTVHFCCVTYLALSIGIDYSIKHASDANNGKYPLEPASSVLIVELCKLIIAVSCSAFHIWNKRKQGGEFIIPDRVDVGWFMVPGLVHTCNNIIIFTAIRNVPLVVLSTIHETSLLWYAFFWTIAFGITVSNRRWLSLSGACLGGIMTHVSVRYEFEFNWGIIWPFVLAFLTAFGGVATECGMKRTAAIDISLQNSVLFTFSTLFSFLFILVFRTSLLSDGIFNGFQTDCIRVLLLQVITGLVVNYIFKYMDSVTKAVTVCLRGPGVLIIEVAFFHSTGLNSGEFISMLVVCLGCASYFREGPMRAETCQTLGKTKGARFRPWQQRSADVPDTSTSKAAVTGNALGSPSSDASAEPSATPIITNTPKTASEIPISTDRCWNCPKRRPQSRSEKAVVHVPNTEKTNCSPPRYSLNDSSDDEPGKTVDATKQHLERYTLNDSSDDDYKESTPSRCSSACTPASQEVLRHISPNNQTQ